MGVGPDRCPGCETVPPRRVLGEVAVREGRFRLERCAECGVVRLAPPPDDAALEAAYDEGYYGPGHARFAPFVERRVVRAAARRIGLVARACPPPARVLDVGCGRGEVLAALARRGYEVHGTERSEASARRAREESRAPVFAGELAGARHPDRHFDCVLVWHVVEHLRDPDGTMAEIGRVLRPGGTLLLECPNVESWQAALGGAGWFHYDPPRHLQNFGVKSLRRLAERHGFAVARVSTFSLLQGPFGMLQSALNRIVRPRDALYDWLRRTPASRGFPLAAKAASLALLPIAAPSALFAEGFAVLAGRGGVASLRLVRRGAP